MALRTIGLTACFILLCCNVSNAQQDPRLVRLDSLFNSIENKQQSMGGVALFQNGRAVYERAFGYMDDDDGQWLAADLDTRYRIGSITKTFTAVLALMLVEDEAISLDTKVSEYFPDVPNADKITVEHLLQQRSGLFNITNAPDYPTWMTQAQSRDQMMGRIEAVATNFEPGTKFEYSNTGYILLGFMLEEASGTSYAELLDERIAVPLDLASTYVAESGDPYPEEARSYTKSGDGWSRTPVTDMSVPGAAGAVVSTPHELGLFFEALFAGDLVSESHLSQMQQLVDGYGFGLVRIPMGNHVSFGHSGSIDGFSSVAAHFPADDFTFSLLNNGSAMSTNDIAIGVLSIWFGMPYTIPTFEAVEVTAAELDQYVGEYSSEAIPLGITVTREGSQLFAQATGQAKFPLTAMGGGVFQFDAAGIKMTFDASNGTMVMQQGGGRFPYTKKD